MVIRTTKEGENNLPLLHKRILITRAREQAEEFSSRLKDYGAKVISFPTIEIIPPDDWRPVDQAIEKLDTYDWLIFTSVNGVRSFTRRMKEKRKEISALNRKMICAIGPRTKKELEERGLEVTYIPSEYRAERVVEGLKDQGINGVKILMPRAKGARRILPNALREAGAVVDEVKTYKAISPAKSKDSLEEILRNGIDVVAFTSSSTVRNFMKLVSSRNFLDGVTVAVIGPVTEETARRCGLKPTIVPFEYTIPGLVKAITEYFKKVPN
jgi:uroporphyrinogen III methyltransferase/synthase